MYCLLLLVTGNQSKVLGTNVGCHAVNDDIQLKKIQWLDVNEKNCHLG